VSRAKSLVIVESPAKAKTIAGYLGSDFIVESSIGHIRDLPKGAGDVPAEYKGTNVGRLGVDVDHDFKPIYVVDSQKRDHIKRLKELLKGVDQLYLATDEDREGESIAWHLLEVLRPKVPVKRMALFGRCPGSAPHLGPLVRLRSIPRVVEEGDAEVVRGPRAKCGHAHRRAA
jgi:DNA topoisomerase I